MQFDFKSTGLKNKLLGRKAKPSNKSSVAISMQPCLNPVGITPPEAQAGNNARKKNTT